MKVLVTGGRGHTAYEDRMWLYAGLSLLHGMNPITEVIEGDADGFDHHAKNWALWRRACGDVITLTTVPARWQEHGRSAGVIRNIEMAKMKPSVVLACPGGVGTQHMIDTAKAHGLKVVMLEKMPVVRGAPVLERPPAA
jgi:hypothetical protein